MGSKRVTQFVRVNALVKGLPPRHFREAVAYLTIGYPALLTADKHCIIETRAPMTANGQPALQSLSGFTANGQQALLVAFTCYA